MGTDGVVANQGRLRSTTLVCTCTVTLKQTLKAGSGLMGLKPDRWLLIVYQLVHRLPRSPNPV
jgi:hypothetical protein